MEETDRTMVQEVYSALRNLWQEGLDIDRVEGGMTVELVPEGRRSSGAFHSLNAQEARHHDRLIKRLRQICRPLLTRAVTMTSDVALPMGEDWVEYQGEYGNHGVTGLICGVAGYVLYQADVNEPFSLLQLKRYKYCIVVATTRADIQEAPFGIAWNRHPQDIRRALCPIRGLGEGWWHQINRFEPQSRFVEDGWI